MQYTLVVTVWRLATLLGAALYFRDVEDDLRDHRVRRGAQERGYLPVAAARAACWCSAGTTTVLREQMRLVAPLGLGSMLNKANDFGRVVVGTQMGPVPLAIYTTAAYQVPLVNIVQTSLSDVIFPDMVKRAQRDPREGLRLWKRAQMMVAAVICPRGCC